MARFGEAIRDGYQVPINAAIRSIASDPKLAGSHDRPELGRGIRSLHLMSCRNSVKADQKITRPRHFVVYRQLDDVIHVMRSLHDAMDLPEHRTT